MFTDFSGPMSALPVAGTAGQLPLPLAMAYVPPQKWTVTYTPDEALMTGTFFPALDLPFKGGRTQ